MLEIINNSTRMSNHGWIVVWEYYTAGKLIKLCRSEKKIENSRMQERERSKKKKKKKEEEYLVALFLTRQ